MGGGEGRGILARVCARRCDCGRPQRGCRNAGVSRSGGQAGYFGAGTLSFFGSFFGMVGVYGCHHVPFLCCPLRWGQASWGRGQPVGLLGGQRCDGGGWAQVFVSKTCTRVRWVEGGLSLNAEGRGWGGEKSG